MSEKITVDIIRRKFFNPSSSPMENREPSPNEYCVGGAFCLYLGYPAKMALTGQRFDYPAAGSLAGVIQEHTGLKKWRDAYRVAREIISLNDNARFDDAWKKLDSVLSGTNTPAGEGEEG